MPSRVIRRFRHDAGRLELSITFVSGRTYVYLGVTESVFEAMKASRSKGEFFNAAIRPNFPFVRRDDTPPR